MEGGIRAWKGLVAEGAPESRMAYFSSATRPEELIALAWLLEDGSRKFYSGLNSLLQDRGAADLFKELVTAEERHQASLSGLYKQFSGGKPDAGFPGSVIPPGTQGDVMEGGVNVSQALKWAATKELTKILEMSISLETNSYDLYIRMKRQVKDPRSAQVFDLLSGEEKNHLQRLSQLLEKRV